MDRSHLERQEETRRHRPDGVSDGLIQGLTGLGLSVLGKLIQLNRPDGVSDGLIQGLTGLGLSVLGKLKGNAHHIIIVL